MDFTAIDFETATHQSDSACQLAAVRVRRGEIVAQAAWLIRPRPFYISPRNIEIHGITSAMVRDEPEFGELWPTIAETIGEDCLVAHNASFDLGVLLACLKTHGQSVPDLQYSCTRAIAKRTWPNQPRFGLKPLSDWLGVRFKHHDALEDSIACARIALAAADQLGAQTLEQLESKLALSRGLAGTWGKKGPSAARRSNRKHRSASAGVGSNGAVGGGSAAIGHDTETTDLTKTVAGVDLQRLMVRAEFIRPLAGQRIVFTGAFTRIARKDAERLTSCCGGRCLQSVSRLTNLLIVGEPDARTRRAGRSQSAKEEKARELIAGGAEVRILSEDDFLRLIAQSIHEETQKK